MGLERLWRRWAFQLELVWKWRLRASEVIKVLTLRFPGEPKVDVGSIYEDGELWSWGSLGEWEGWK